MVGRRRASVSDQAARSSAGNGGSAAIASHMATDYSKNGGQGLGHE